MLERVETHLRRAAHVTTVGVPFLNSSKHTIVYILSFNFINTSRRYRRYVRSVTSGLITLLAVTHLSSCISVDLGLRVRVQYVTGACPYKENIRILEVDAREAEGPCWGRHLQVSR